jgi:hypothetical protein
LVSKTSSHLILPTNKQVNIKYITWSVLPFKFLHHKLHWCIGFFLSRWRVRWVFCSFGCHRPWEIIDNSSMCNKHDTKCSKKEEDTI